MIFSRDILNRLVLKAKEYREHMHRFPELSFQEFKTMEFVSDKLSEIGIPHQKNVAATGVIGIIRGEHHSDSEPCVGLRSELDALPIVEQTNAEYASKNEGVMHACGHDVHTAIHLAAAEYLWSIRDELPKPVKLIFQPGEEKNPGGASLLIKEDVLHNPKVESLFALHVYPEMEAGKVGFREGLYMASCDEIYITINGKGGHGAMPHQAVDPIMIGAQLLTSLQQIVSRNCDPKIPCVLSFGHFEALGATNVIPEKAILKGTFRTMDETWRAKAHKLIELQVNSICQAFGATANFEISLGYPMLFNNEELTTRMRKSAITEFGENKVEDLPLRLTSEDFAYYSQEIPVCFFRLGVRNEKRGLTFGVHHPKFDIDYGCLETGIRAMCLAPFI